MINWLGSLPATGRVEEGRFPGSANLGERTRNYVHYRINIVIQLLIAEAENTKSSP